LLLEARTFGIWLGETPMDFCEDSLQQNDDTNYNNNYTQLSHRAAETCMLAASGAAPGESV